MMVDLDLSIDPKTASYKRFERVTGDASEGGIDRLVLYSDITFEFFELGTWEL